MPKKLMFPKGFLWGSATAAHQVEGGNIYNDWHLWELAGKIKDRQRSGLACDHYNRFREDIDLLVRLNQNAYRFSIEWSRIEPERGKIVRREIDHYGEVLTYLREKKVKSFVTLHHFTNPTWFDWERDDSVGQFRSFAQLIAEELGHFVDFWCTINEPTILAEQAYVWGNFPPGKESVESFFRALDNMIAGHNAAYQAIHEVLPDALVGLAQNSEYFHSASDDPLDRLVTEIGKEIRNHYVLDRTTGDFIGLNYYEHKKLRFNPSSPRSFYSEHVADSLLPVSEVGWEIFPDGLYHVLIDLKKYGKPIYITENGIADAKDKQRKNFIMWHLRAAHGAIADGVDLRGYLHWSILRNFEWEKGYGADFGLCGIDFATQERIIRPSALWYAGVCKTGVLSA